MGCGRCSGTSSARTLLRETIAAHDRLLRPQERGVEAGGSAGAAGVSAIPLPAELRHRAQGRLIGRQSEIAELEERWTLACGGAGAGLGPGRRPGSGISAGTSPGSDADDGGGRIVLLAGDAGIGKTTLIAELARQVHGAGAIVLAGRSPRETVVPYQPFLEALRHWALNALVADAAREHARVRARARAADPRAPPARP